MGTYVRWTWDGREDHILVQTNPIYLHDVQKEFVNQGYYVDKIHRVEDNNNVVFIEFYKEK